MTIDSGRKLQEAAFENARMERIQDYVRRGRQLRNVETGELKKRWAEIVRQRAVDPFNGEMLDRYEDVDSELRLRREAPPAESVADASDEAAQKIIAELELILRDDPVRANEIAELLKELEERVPRRGRTSDS